MRRYSRRAAIAVTAFTVLAACSKTDVPRTDTASRTAAATAARSATMPGALTKPIDAYTADELSALVQSLTFTGGQDRARDCRNNSACTDTVRIDAVATQDSIGPSTTPQYGVIYLRAMNKGTAPEARYGFLPGANNQYYVILTTDSAKAMHWRMELLDTAARTHSSAGTGVLTSCKGHQFSRGARADFKTCDQASARSAPFWASCEEGCCPDATNYTK